MLKYLAVPFKQLHRLAPAFSIDRNFRDGIPSSEWQEIEEIELSHERIHSHPIRPPRSLCNDVRTLCWKFSLRSSRWRVHTELRPVQKNVRTVLPRAELRRFLCQVQRQDDPRLRGRKNHSALPPSIGR